MGIFKNITKTLKEAAPLIGSAVGMYYGGSFGAALGSGIGSLAAGRSTEEALKNAALTGATAYLAGGKDFGRDGKFSTEGSPLAGRETVGGVKNMGGQPGPGFESIPVKETSFIDKLIPESTTGKLLLGGGILGLAGGMGEEEKTGSISQRPYPEGKARLGVGLVGNKKYNLNDDDERTAYFEALREQQGITSLRAGGEVEGPGTGTSDSVPARLSDGEFVVTAKAVRGAGGGDRNVGAARMYDMMSNLERVA
jgi:hypothetical protein